MVGASLPSSTDTKAFALSILHHIHYIDHNSFLSFGGSEMSVVIAVKDPARPLLRWAGGNRVQ